MRDELRVERWILDRGPDDAGAIDIDTEEGAVVGRGLQWERNSARPVCVGLLSDPSGPAFDHDLVQLFIVHVAHCLAGDREGAQRPAISVRDNTIVQSASTTGKGICCSFGSEVVRDSIVRNYTQGLYGGCRDVGGNVVF